MDLTSVMEHKQKASNIESKAGPWFITDEEGAISLLLPFLKQMYPNNLQVDI